MRPVLVQLFFALAEAVPGARNVRDEQRKVETAGHPPASNFRGATGRVFE